MQKKTEQNHWLAALAIADKVLVDERHGQTISKGSERRNPWQHEWHAEYA